LVQELDMGSSIFPRLSIRFGFIAIAAVLAGCEGTVSVDLGTNPPADPAIRDVLVEIEGVEFRKSGGGVQAFRFDSPQQVNLMNYLDGNDFRLLTDEELSDGRYSGVRLLFGADEEKENAVILTDERDFELDLAGTEVFSAVDFTVDKDDSSNESVQLTLDLRQSLQFDDDEGDDPLLTPVIRAIRTEDAGGVAGNVTVNCPANSVLAIYLFPGEVTPDDIDGNPPEPYLTTAVGLDGNVSSTGYAFAFLPEGTYTLASTCDADEETPAGDEALDFDNAVTVDVDAESSVTQNIPD
jgi:Domain of unknown function (DUF4382)